jgi:hypothetical protein
VILRFIFFIIFASGLTLFYTNCGPGMDSRYYEYLSTSLDRPICDKNQLYTSVVPLMGLAEFQKRSLALVTEGSRVTNMTLSDPLEEMLPIQNAEVVVYNEYNHLIQCGKTDEYGNFKSLTGTDLMIPSIAGNYKVRVNARSKVDFGGDNNLMNIAVKKDIYQEEVYSIEKSFYSNGSTGESISLQAKARQLDTQEIEAGAFNILNTIQKSYEYIKVNTAGIDTSCMSAELPIYWKAGFNPMQYESPNADPATLGNTSYYSKKSKRLFITGGQLGNVSLANTDHFDDFAIIHEFGHFLEDHCGQWTSPGGSHSLIVRIDPRLAWSEAWANFLAAQVMNSKLAELDPSMPGKLTAAGEINGWTYFFNSSGFSDSVQNVGNGNGFLIDFKRAGIDPGQWPIGTPYSGIEYDRVIAASFPGEGHFREGAISRGLFKTTNTCGTFCTPSAISFSEIWKSFDRLTGLGTQQNPFVSSHGFFENLKARVGLSAGQESTIVAEALQLRSSGTYSVSGVTNWVPFGHRLVQSGSPCPLKIQPRPDDSSLTGGQSDQRYSNHFYTLDLYDPTLNGLTSINVTFTKVAGSTLDHDIILFNPDYVFNDDYLCSALNTSTGACEGTWSPQRTTTEHIALANRSIATTPGTTYTKVLNNISSLDKEKFYLLDLRAYTATSSPLTSTEYSYVINSNLGPLCPQ